MKQDVISATETLLRDLLAQRILILDGAMGTMIQQYKLNEQDYRGQRFADFKAPAGERELFVQLALPRACTRDAHRRIDAPAATDRLRFRLR